MVVNEHVGKWVMRPLPMDKSFFLASPFFLQDLVEFHQKYQNIYTTKKLTNTNKNTDKIIYQFTDKNSPSVYTKEITMG